MEVNVKNQTVDIYPCGAAGGGGGGGVWDRKTMGIIFKGWGTEKF
jgi:hypothetical protein